jgi:predicted trehalose synthase
MTRTVSIRRSLLGSVAVRSRQTWRDRWGQETRWLEWTDERPTPAAYTKALDYDPGGEVTRPLGVRRLKRSPLRDVASMLRSFHYASHAALFGKAGGIRPEDVAAFEPWARFWYAWVSAAFLATYLPIVGEAALLPRAPDDLRVLLDTQLLEKAIYELGCELQHRPDWVRVPLQGILQLLEVAP